MMKKIIAAAVVGVIALGTLGKVILDRKNDECVDCTVGDDPDTETEVPEEE